MGNRIGYLDMIGGASGDMLLGALIDAGVSLNELRSELEKVPVGGYALTAEKVRRASLEGTLVSVKTDAEGERTRTFDEFDAAVRRSGLPEHDKTKAASVFETLRAAETAAHGGSDSHLHELGTVDTLVDVVGAVTGLRLLGIGELHASPFPSGLGISRSSHGASAATAPATQHIYLSRGVPVRTGGDSQPVGEAVTPTGAAVIATLADFGPISFSVTRIGYGAGRRNPGAYPNMLGLWVGEEATRPGAARPDIPEAQLRGGLTLLETNMDDMPGEVFGFVQERLFEAGALDVWFTPIQMKKNRPGVMLSATVPADKAAAAVKVILRETSTLGVRTRSVERYEAAREVIEAVTSLGRVPVKVKRLGGEIVDASPEYEVCRGLSLKLGVPLQEVMRRVQAEALRSLEA